MGAACVGEAGAVAEPAGVAAVGVPGVWVPPGVFAPGVADPEVGEGETDAAGVAVAVGVPSSSDVGGWGGGGTYGGIAGSSSTVAVTVMLLWSPMTSMNVDPRSKAISWPWAS